MAATFCDFYDRFDVKRRDDFELNLRQASSYISIVRAGLWKR